jgi:hypothetical protein
VDKPKSRPFKKFFCDRPDTLKLPGNALKVWLYHYAREGQERKSWPALETVAEGLDLDVKAVKRARQRLIAGGWLKKTGERTVDGRFTVPIMTATRGVIPLPDYKPEPQKRTMEPSPKKGLRTQSQKRATDGSQIGTTDPVPKWDPEVEPEKQLDTQRSISQRQSEGRKVRAESQTVKEMKSEPVAESLGKIPSTPGSQSGPTDNPESQSGTTAIPPKNSTALIPETKHSATVEIPMWQRLNRDNQKVLYKKYGEAWHKRCPLPEMESLLAVQEDRA